MRCPYCASQNTKVIDTGHDSRGGVRRRRECQGCGQRFSTYERAILATPVLIKEGGIREEFDREKLIRSVLLACGKRPVAIAEVERLADEVEARLQELGKKEVPSKLVGDWMIEALRELDPIAYLRYAIVYKNLNTLEAVRDEVDALITEKYDSRGATQAR